MIKQKTQEQNPTATAEYVKESETNREENDVDTDVNESTIEQPVLEKTETNRANLLKEVDEKLSNAVQELVDKEANLFEKNAEVVLSNELMRTYYLREVTGSRLASIVNLAEIAEKTSAYEDLMRLAFDVNALYGAEGIRPGTEANDLLIDQVDVLKQVTLREGSAETVTVNLEPIQQLQEVYARLAESCSQGHEDLQRKINNSIVRLAKQKAGSGEFRVDHLDEAEAELREKYSKAFEQEKALRENAAFARNQLRMLRAIETAAVTPEEELAEERMAPVVTEFDESLVVPTELQGKERYRIILGAEPETKTEVLMVNEDRLEQKQKLEELIKNNGVEGQIITNINEHQDVYSQFEEESHMKNMKEAELSPHMQQVFEIALQIATDEFENRAMERTVLAERHRAELSDTEESIQNKARAEAQRRIAEQLPRVISRVKKQALLKTGVVEHVSSALTEKNESEAPHRQMNNSTIEGMEVAIVLSAIYEAASSEPTLRDMTEVVGSSPDADAYRLLSELAVELNSLDESAVANRVERLSDILKKMVGGVENIDEETIIIGDSELSMDTLDFHTKGGVQLKALRNQNTRSNIDPARYRRLE